MVNHSLLPGGEPLKGTIQFAGGCEMFLNPTPGIISQVGWSASTPYVPSLDNWQTPNPNANLSDPFPTVIQPLGAAGGPLTGLRTGMSFMNPHYKMPNFSTFDVSEDRAGGNRRRDLLLGRTLKSESESGLFPIQSA